MKIVVAVRCYNESKNIERFMRGYDFADTIVVSDGGSEDDSVSILKEYPKVEIHHYRHYEIINGERFNPDNPHINFVLNKAKEHDPDWLIFDDMDDVPNRLLRESAREILENCEQPQVNAFRLYMWGDTGNYFPFMNRHFDSSYRSIWAFNPNKIDIHADESLWHGTLVGLSSDVLGIDPPMCLLHKSWYPETIDEKIRRYTSVGIQMGHPFDFAGELEKLPEWAIE